MTSGTHGHGAQDKHVGLLLPASVGGALANIATLMAGRMPVNLNFTIGAEAMRAAIAQAGIRTILTSKRFLSKAGIDELPGMVFLEDLRKEIGGLRKDCRARRGAPPAGVGCCAAARRHGSRRTRRRRSSSRAAAPARRRASCSRTPTSWRTWTASIRSFPMEPADCFIGVLPFFHSFGFTGTLWFPLLQGAASSYHPNPMDAKTIGELAGEYRASMLISTPTFCNAYLRRCTPEQFGT